MEGHIQLSRAAFTFNDIRGGSASSGVKITLTNKGGDPIALSDGTIGGTDAAQFAITGQPTGTLAPGQSTTVTATYSAPSSTGLGIHTATLSIPSTDPSAATLTIPLRGLATAGTGGQLEPSLQRIFDLYQLGIATGDANPANTNLFSPSEPLGTNDEVVVQTLVKAASGNVTITPLASFAGGSPASRVGYYTAGSAGDKTELFTIGAADAQTVNPTAVGTTSFDPGAGTFGLYVNFPIFGNTAYSEDKLNTSEITPANKRKVRFYPYKVNGQVVANAYVFTSEDFINDPTGSYDTNDFIGIIQNVKLAGVGSGSGCRCRMPTARHQIPGWSSIASRFSRRQWRSTTWWIRR